MIPEFSYENRILYVSNDGKIPDIQTAIKMAKPNQIIQVYNGFYKGFVVTKPGITIEAVSGHESVVILADKGDSITIDCPMENPVILRNLKVAHTVSKTELDISKLINLFFKHNKSTRNENLDSHSSIAKDYSKNLVQVCLLRIIRGEVYASNCFFSYKVMSKSLETITPAIVVEPKSKLHLVSCEVIGHRIYQTIGIICQKGTLIIDDCKVYSNLHGGISALIGLITRQRWQTGIEKQHRNAQ